MPMNRREFLAVAGTAGAGTAVRGAELPGTPQAAMPAAGERAYWVTVLRRIADPVLTNLAGGTLRARMPVEQAAGADRRAVTHLEAAGRLIAGLAPWIELPADGTSEGRLRGEYADLTRRAIARAVDPASPDFLVFTDEHGSQPLVDAAFLAHGIVRAPRTLRDALDATTRRQLVAALESTRVITPGFNNWLLFAAMVEAGLASLGARWDHLRVDYALRQHEQWYKGDGIYGDGPSFHWDYYNSFVIQPMLLDVLDACADGSAAWRAMQPRADDRARRYAAILERLIAPDGSYPAIGRSLAYRCGAFQLLAQVALRRALPETASPAQVRSALTAVMRRTLEAPGTFDANGWLQIGLCGHQPGVGEGYISTGSLYLCAVGFLPLGLPPADPFWSAPAEPWTSVKVWNGQPFPIDHAL
jgi:hypothetical protein